jgi:teichuronic acid biosynthesis glycosyltransferase TuaC
MPRSAEVPSNLHVLTLTPFFPSDRNEVHGCFVAEPIAQFHYFGVDSTVIAVSQIYRARKHSIPSAAGEWVRFPQIPGTFGLPSAGQLLYARLLLRIRELHKTKPIDIIHAHGAMPCGHAAALLARHLEIPFVVTVHGLDVFNTCARAGIPAAWRHKVSAEVYAAARNVICISGKVQEVLKAGALPHTSSTVVYNGVDANLFSPCPHNVPRLNPEVLIVGTLLQSKGHELVLRALIQIKPSFPTIQCRIIGEGPDRTRFESLVNELGIGQLVQFVGRQSRSQVAEAMRRCSVFALPSRNEGLGCVFLEAMACGKPVIGCRGQGIDGVIEQGGNGFLIPADGLQELVQELSALLRSPEMRERVGTAARQTILKEFTLSHQAQQLIAVYRQAIA